MSLKSDRWIKKMCRGENPLISPFHSETGKEIFYRNQKIKVPSFGLSSAGYDLRLSNRFKLLDTRATPGKQSLIDFADPDMGNLFQSVQADSLEIHPGGFVLGVSEERISMPDNILGVCMAKSTLARCGLDAKVTPIEPNWSGFITIELQNTTDARMRIYAGMGIMQLLFFEIEGGCEFPYDLRSNKYQDQPKEPIVAKL